MKIEEVTGTDPRMPKDLLLQADPSVESINRYILNSSVFIGSLDERAIAVAVLQIEDRDAEIMNISVDSLHQGRGFGRRMISHLKRHLAKMGFDYVSVGTGNSSLEQLAFYQKNGFRFLAIHKNHFKDYYPPIYENGIRCIDMINLRSETKISNQTHHTTAVSAPR